LFILLAVVLPAAEVPDVILRIQPEGGIRVGQPFRLTLDVAGGDVSTLPDLQGLLGDPFRAEFTGSGTSANVSIINGKSVSRKSLMLNWVVVPLVPGDYNIPAITVMTVNGPATTLPVGLTVLGTDDVPFRFVVTTGKDTWYAGEAIDLSLELHFPSRSLDPRIRELVPDDEFPQIIGSIDIDPPVLVSKDNASLWKTGKVLTVRSVGTGGTMTIPPVRCEFIFDDYDRSRSDTFGQRQSSVLFSEPLTLTILQPPEKLIGTSGSRLEIKTGSPRVLEGDTVSVSVILSGIDNPDQADMPVSKLEQAFGRDYIWKAEGEGTVESDSVVFHFTALPMIPSSGSKGSFTLPITDKETGSVLVLDGGTLPLEVLPVGKTVMVEGWELSGAGSRFQGGQSFFTIGEILNSRARIISRNGIDTGLWLLTAPVVPVLILFVILVLRLVPGSDPANPEHLARRLYRLLRKRKGRPPLIEIYGILVHLNEAGVYKCPELLSSMEAELFSGAPADTSGRSFDKPVTDILKKGRGPR
jgi:hypothetical protein